MATQESKKPGTGGGFRNLRIILFAGLFIGLVSVVLVFLYIIRDGNRDAEREKFLELSLLSRFVSDRIETNFETGDYLLNSIFREIQRFELYGNADSADLFDLFSAHIDLFNRGQQMVPLSALFYVDESGIMRGTSVASEVNPLDVSNRDYFLYHRDRGGGIYISPISVSPNSGIPAIYLSREVSDGRGNFRGVLGLSFRIGELSSLFESLGLSENYTIAIHTAEGAPLFRFPAADNFADSDVSGNPAFQEMLAGEAQGTIKTISPFDGRYRLVAYTRGSEYPIIAIVSEAADTAFAAWSETRLLIYVLMSAALVLLFALAVVLNYQFEQLRLQTQAVIEAETTSRAKTSFLANMSHEIRTPLNAILGMLDIGLSADSSGEKNRYMRKAETAGNHLLDLISGILDISRIEAGKLVIHQRPFSPKDLLQGVAEVYSSMAEHRGLFFKLELAGALPSALSGDRLRVQQILHNLIGNAMKFTEVGGITLKVKTEQIRQGYWRLIFSVIDSGIGIPQEQQSALFEYFSQVDSTPSRQFGGTGLGLAISKQLVLAMGGSIELESVPGRGSRFTFQVEFEESEDRDLPVHSHGVIDLTGMRVLAVEDNDLNREVIRNYLENAGIVFSMAVDGIDATQRCEGQRFDAILMDCQMPRMDGYETARALRKMGIRTPIIALTANALPEEIEQTRDAGMDAFLSKPVKREDVLSELSRWFGADPLTGNSPGPEFIDNIGVPEDSTIGRENATIDKQAALEFMDGDMDLFRRLIKLMADELPAYKKGLLEEAGSKNPEQIASKAHSIKGMASTIHANELHRRAHELELMAKKAGADWRPAMEPVLESMDDLASALKAEMDSWR
jgi:signal transduction histidine kinase/DNA-binding response OmpR family regulator